MTEQPTKLDRNPELDTDDACRNANGTDAGTSAPRSCRSDPAMNDTNADDKSNAGLNCEKLINFERNGECCGALELEYPGATLYRDIFERYVPEIADWLVDQRCVRFLVETVYNLRVCGELLLDAPGVTERTAYSVLSMAEKMVSTLLKVCDQIADAYRVENRYPAREELS